MSYFNEEQISYMKELASIPPTKKCWCGWYELEQCPNCPNDKTAADKLAVSCEHCHSAPYRPGDELIHRRGCPLEGEQP